MIGPQRGRGMDCDSGGRDEAGKARHLRARAHHHYFTSFTLSHTPRSSQLLSSPIILSSHQSWLISSLLLRFCLLPIIIIIIIIAIIVLLSIMLNRT